MSRPERPVILFVFANPRRDLALNRETSGIRAAWRARRDIELIVLDHPALAEIEDTFQNRRNQIVAFHYSGHANGFQQMLECEMGSEQRIHVSGFAEFLASQKSLRFIFLNGCSTDGQVDEFFAAGVPCVLATTTEVDDEVATRFSIRFYTGLGTGADLQTAYEEAVGSIKSQTTGLPKLSAPANRGIRVGNRSSPPAPKFPWQIHAQNEQALTWSLDDETSRRRPSREPVNQASQTQLQRLLNLVEQHWVEGVLERNSASNLLALEKMARPDFVNDPFEGLVEYASQDREAVGADQSITDIFHRVHKRLLLLGQPGSGKTTTLLQLTRELVDQAQRDPTLPVPVVLSLSRWSDPTQSFHDWLQAQLSDLYAMPRRLTAAWIDRQELILLLDGLDEIEARHRDPCVLAMNRFLDQTGVAGMVVVSRVDEYAALTQRLRVAGALHLQPLSEGQIREFVSAGGERLNPLRTMLEHNESLRSLAQSPLLLNIMSQVYDDPDVAHQSDTRSTPQSQTNDLFHRFIDRMFQRRGRGQPKFDRQTTESGLAYLGHQMQSSGSSLFLLERMQPSWLSRGQLFVYFLTISAVLAWFIGGTLAIFWCSAAQISADTASAIRHGLWWWPTAICFVWFLMACGLDRFLPNGSAHGDGSRWKIVLQGTFKACVYMAMWLVLMCIQQLLAPEAADAQWMQLVLTGAVGSLILAAAGWQHRTMLDIQPAEAISFCWKRAGAAAPVGLVAGVVVWFLFRMVWTEEPQISIILWNTGHSQGFLYMLICLAVIGAMAGAIVAGVRRSVLTVRIRPNQGMMNSRRNAWRIGLGSGAVMTATMLTLMLLQDLRGTERTIGQLILFSLGIGWAVAACTSCLFGGFDYLKHQTLKWIVTATGQLPKPLGAFLDYACELSFLKPVGGGYLFLHRLLQNHFAERANNCQNNGLDSRPK
jgi:eukaryotic-like serine/threonine-protein kinase